MTSKATRIFTGIAGLPASQDPIKELVKHYGRLLRALSELPKESKYRIQTEQLIMERKEIVESCTDPVEVENKLGGGLCEEFIEQAKAETYLTQIMNKYKTWEPLVEKPPENQWKWPL